MIDLLRQFAEVPPAIDQGQQAAERLAAQATIVQSLLSSDDPEVRLLAACALARLDTAVAGIVMPTLIQGLHSEDESHQVYAAFACRCLGPLATPAVPALVEVFNDQEHDIAQYHALQALEAIGPAAAGAVPTLIEILRGVGPDSPGNEVLHALGAIAALGAIGPAAATAIPILRECVGLDPAGDELITMLKADATVALGKIGEEAR